MAVRIGFICYHFPSCLQTHGNDGAQVPWYRVAITDHDNYVNGDVAHNTWADPEFKSDSVLLLYAAEWTTTRGHGNAFSATPYDHQRLYDPSAESFKILLPLFYLTFP